MTCVIWKRVMLYSERNYGLSADVFVYIKAIMVMAVYSMF